MTDLELTKLCAEAVGLIPHKDQIPLVCHTGKNLRGIPVSTMYDPLHDDAQAMALVKKFSLSVGPADGDDWCAWDNDDSSIEQGYDENLNRAIVECVAGMKGANGRR